LILYDRDESIIKQTNERFRHFANPSQKVTTILANHDNNVGFDLCADIVMSNPAFDAQTILTFLANMETFSRDDALKLVVVPLAYAHHSKNFVLEINKLK
jgi:hypothetical protein